MTLDLRIPGPIGTNLQRVSDQSGGESALQLAANNAFILANFTGGTSAIVSVTNVQAGNAPPGPTVLRLRRENQFRWEVRHLENNTFDIFHTDAEGSSQSPMVIGTDGAVNLSNLPVLTGAELTIDTGGNINKQSSSARFKEDIEPFQDDFDKALRLQAKSFTIKGSGQKAFGYLAEDVDELGLHDLVGYDEEGRPDSVRYKQLGIYAIELLREQEGVLEQQKAKIAKLESFLEELEATAHREPMTS